MFVFFACAFCLLYAKTVFGHLNFFFKISVVYTLYHLVQQRKLIQTGLTISHKKTKSKTQYCIVPVCTCTSCSIYAMYMYISKDKTHIIVCLQNFHGTSSYFGLLQDRSKSMIMFLVCLCQIEAGCGRQLKSSARCSQ